MVGRYYQPIIIIMEPPTLRDLYPNLNEEELSEVEDTLEQYLELVLRIFERVEAEEKQGT